VSRTKTVIIAITALVLTFAAGMAAGVFTSHLMILRGGPGAARFPNAMVHHLDRRLDLTDVQRTRIEAIIKRRHAHIDQMWDNVRPKVRAEIERTNQEIERVLTPEQRARFKRMRMRMGH
jgi:Spy/CpxP family protein refolding chaperone